MLERDQWVTLAIIFVIVFGGTLVTLYSVRQKDDLMRSDLLTKSRIAAAYIDPYSIEALTGSASDLTLPEYIRCGNS